MTTHYIDGEWIAGEGTPFTSHNPASQERIWEGREATPQEVARALCAAKNAFPHWRALTVQKRIDFLRAFASLVEKKSAQLAQTISEEVGKPLWESQTEVSALINKVPITIESYQERCQVRRGGEQRILTTYHKPQGALGVFAPFNFPAHLPHGHIIPALICGNTVVLKSSELAPKTATLLTQIWEEVGLPKGVFNLIHGGETSGKALVAHPDLDGLLFTGSYPVGKTIQESFQRDVGKILALELGGNNPLIVSQCRDIKAAVYNTLLSAYLTTGQRCASARRLIVVGDHSPFLDALIAGAKSIRVAPYTSTPEPFMGPLIDNKSKERLLDVQKKLIAQGCVPLLPMEEIDPALPFLTPGILDATERKLPDEEHFGPLLKVIRVPTFAHAIEVANETAYGLSAALLSDEEEEFTRFLEMSHAGVVNWNVPTVGASSRAPFGGVGKSGNHHPSAYYAVDYCTYPVASTTEARLTLPETLYPGIL